ncbi:ATP-binding protein [Novosphingobium sp.]|jgi:two-component system sensor histidine kinase KdpD|uniref:ATP-binding protein n=1 Tax=Novosphingobium sp. TaxID=1874826 RepID=UPI0031DD6D4F
MALPTSVASETSRGMVEPAPSPFTPSPAWYHIAPRQLAWGFSLLIVASAFGVELDGVLEEGYISLIFVMVITVIGALYGLGVALICAAVGALGFDFFIGEPKWELSFTRANDITTPLIFTFSAMISGLLSGRLKDETRQVRQRNIQLEALLEASRGLQRAGSVRDVTLALHDGVEAQTGIAVALQGISLAAGQPEGGESALMHQALASGQDWLEDGAMSAFPLAAGPQTLGVLLARRPEGVLLDHDFMLALARMTALALERIYLADRLAEAHAAARAEELKSALLSSVSHDLRSPLTAINTAAASLLTYGEHFDPETSHGLLSGIVEESDRLNHLTTNLLQMTRLEGGPGGLSRSVLPAVEMIRNVVARQARIDTEHRFALNAPDGEVSIVADATLYDLVLTNVIQNACRYSPFGTTVEITCREQGTMCAIAISDEGIGVPPAEQGHVFERFYRVRRDDGAPRGTGLGLAIARGFVKASDGTIELSSPLRDGKGTCITICLPIAHSEPDQTNA